MNSRTNPVVRRNRRIADAIRSLPVVQSVERRMLMSAGAFDTSFGTAGQEVIPGVFLPQDGQTNEIAVDSQGRTLVSDVYTPSGQHTNLILRRLNTNGTVDTTFNASAALHKLTSINQILPEADGNILLVGGRTIIQITSTGALDTTFSSDAYGNQAVFLPDGKILTVDGLTSWVYRFNANGTPDTTFGTDGADLVPNPYGSVSLTGIKLDSSGRMVLSFFTGLANSTDTIGTARLLANGQLDSSFGSGGYSLATVVAAPSGDPAPVTASLAIAPDGSIDQLGYYSFKGYPISWFVLSFSSNGQQIGDIPFAPPSGPDGNSYSLNDFALQSNGEVVGIGRVAVPMGQAATSFIDRFEPITPASTALTFDPTFDGSGELLLPAGSQFAGGDPLTLDSQGRIEIVTSTGAQDQNLVVSRVLTAGASALPAVQLTGQAIGTAGSYKNDGNTIAKAFDGNLSTFFDAPDANNNWAGLDLGSSQFITQISFAPRSGYTSRMVGGIFQGSTSADFSTGVDDLYTITTAPAAGVLTTVGVGVAGPYRYVRYLAPAGSYGNIAEAQFFGAQELFEGTAIGTSGSYNNLGNTITNAFDGDFTTFFDAPTASGGWGGLDFGSAVAVTQVSFAPRSGYTSRMIGGEIQASNTADFSSGIVTAYTITAAPPAGVLTTVQIASVGAYRYWRYVGPTGGYCNISELEFDGV